MNETVATFRKGVRAVQMVGRASTYKNSNKPLIHVLILSLVLFQFQIPFTGIF